MKFSIQIEYNDTPKKEGSYASDFDYRIRADFDDESAVFVGKTLRLIDEQVAELKEKRRPKEEEEKCSEK